jgi:flagellum-specific ATP synthase
MLADYFRYLENVSWRWSGRVTKATGQIVESEGPFCSIGECCEIAVDNGRRFAGEIIGFRGPSVLSMALEKPMGIRFGDRVITAGRRPSIRVGESLLGRVIDAAGIPIDGKGDHRARTLWPLEGSPPNPLDRVPIRNPIGCGIRAVDAFLTCGRGQRVGIFGGSGVGKSTLIGMMARGTQADMTVLALVGERGREVQEFLEELGEEGLKRAVVVVSTSDQSPLLRLRAALTATAVAEYFSSLGKHVLLVVDSLTRVAMAQREIGLAAGEPPAAKGYTPSVYTMLAKLVERAGQFANGSITGFYSVLMEADDQQDTLVDAVRSFLDGHIVLDRKLAVQNHYPAISVLDSLSRLMSSVAKPEHINKAATIRKMLAAFARSEDLIRVGAYQRGSDESLDRAIAALPQVQAFLQQSSKETASFEQTITALLSLPGV